MILMAIDNQTINYSNKSTRSQDELFLTGTLVTWFLKNSKQVKVC